MENVRKYRDIKPVTKAREKHIYSQRQISLLQSFS